MNMTTDPCGGDTRGGVGCRCDPPFTTTQAEGLDRLFGLPIVTTPHVRPGRVYVAGRIVYARHVHTVRDVLWVWDLVAALRHDLTRHLAITVAQASRRLGLELAA